MMKGKSVYEETVGLDCEEYEAKYRRLLQMLIELEEENQKLNAALKKERKELQGMRELIKSMENDMCWSEETEKRYILRDPDVPGCGGEPSGMLEKYCGYRKDMLYLVR